MNAPDTRWFSLQEFEDLRQRLAAAWLLGAPPAPPSQTPVGMAGEAVRLGALESDGRFLVQAGRPDLRAEDVNVSAEDGVVTISASFSFIQRFKMRRPKPIPP